ARPSAAIAVIPAAIAVVTASAPPPPPPSPGAWGRPAPPRPPTSPPRRPRPRRPSPGCWEPPGHRDHHHLAHAERSTPHHRHHRHHRAVLERPPARRYDRPPRSPRHPHFADRTRAPLAESGLDGRRHRAPHRGLAPGTTLDHPGHVASRRARARASRQG